MLTILGVCIKSTCKLCKNYNQKSAYTPYLRVLIRVCMQVLLDSSRSPYVQIYALSGIVAYITEHRTR